MLEAFPTAATYLAALPDGLGSHGACFAYEVHEGARRQVLERAGDRLDPAAAGLLADQWNERWIPEVRGLVAQLMLADVLGEPEYLRWIYDEARRIYERPFVRHLMRLLSPSLVLLGAASRWSTMHRGSRLGTLRNTDERSKHDPRVSIGLAIDYPAELFPPVFCRALGETFRAACDLAHAEGATVELLEWTPERARFDVGWDR